MGDVVKAASELFAAVLSALGFVGRTRRRAQIRHDLELLRPLDEFDDLGPGTAEEQNHAHRLMVEYITLEVARYTGALGQRKKRPWSSIVVALVLGVPLAYWTWKLNEAGFAWLSLLPGVFAGLFFISVLGMLGRPEEDDESAE